MKRPVRSLAILAVAFAMAGCNSEDNPKATPGSPSPGPTSASKSPGPEAPVRDMNPADPKADDKADEPKPAGKVVEPKADDEPPPLVPPAGATDERPDAAKPR